MLNYISGILILIFGFLSFKGYAKGEPDIVLQPIDTTGTNYKPLKWQNISHINVNSDSTSLNLNFNLRNGDLLDLILDENIIFNGYAVPLVKITTDEAMDQIPDKINYQNAEIEIEGFGYYEDFIDSVKIRGRGNTSWLISDKKPYRLKFEKKKEFCGLNKAKNFVLIANWTDKSLMHNSMAAFIANMFGLEYTNNFQPVDVILNDVYRGSYMLTNKPGINSGSVDINEETSVMWELDNYFDEDLKFMSPVFNMPVNLIDPDMSEEMFEYWKQDYIEMEIAVSEGRASEVIDLDTYAKYRVVNEIILNPDIWHPRSLKMYKTQGGKYMFGPIWDFDAGVGLDWEKQESYVLDKAHRKLGVCSLMQEIDKNPEVKYLIDKYMNYFFEHEDEFWQFVEDYAEYFRLSALRNSIKWPRGDWDESYSQMKNWMEVHIAFLKEIYGFHVSLDLKPSYAVLSPSLPEKVKILSLNNSLIAFHDQPLQFRNIASSMGHTSEWLSHTLYDESLLTHWIEQDYQFNAGISAKSLIATEPWTHIILQETSYYPLRHFDLFEDNVMLFVDYIRSYCPNPDAIIIVPMNWPLIEDNVDYENQFKELEENYQKLAQDLGVVICPVGKAYELMYEKEGLENMKSEFYMDDRHPTLLASYLAALMEYGIVYNEDPALVEYIPENLRESASSEDGGIILKIRNLATEAISAFHNVVDNHRGRVDLTPVLKHEGGFQFPSDGFEWTVDPPTADIEDGIFRSTIPGIYNVTVRWNDLSRMAQIKVAE